ncbi:hypothetical protein AOLI_G00210810, partial [Acnodon oligacanthus]
RQQRPPGGGGGGGKSHNPQQQQQPPQQQQQQQQPISQTQQLGPDHQSEGSNVKHGGRGYQQGRGSHHGYSQNRRWHQHHKQQANSGQGSRNTKEAESVRGEEQELGTERSKDGPAGENSKKEGGKVSLLQSSKERLRRRLKEKEDIPVATVGPQRNRMDKLLEILNSMRSNSSGVEGQLTSFMEEAQNSADSEETLTEIVQTIYRKAVSDRSFAATAAKLCDRMALFMVEGTKFRSLLLNMLQVCLQRPSARRRHSTAQHCTASSSTVLSP